GSATVDQSICILAPLSGNTSCSPPALAPVNGSRFFHYNSEIDSNNSLAEILRTYKARDLSGLAPTGWSAWLRPDAHRVFVEITDDESEPLTAEQFEQALLGLVPGNFGDALRRDYTFHTIGGFGANTPANTAWKPTAPIQTSICTLAVGEGGVAASIEYQKLSLATGGLRYPICQYASFDAIFREVANNVVSSPQVACELKIPTPPNGQKITSAFVTYVPGNGAAPIQLTSVPDAASCAPNSFFVTSGYVRLCSDTCAQIRSDDRAKLEVKASCLAPLG
ncbi:MAG: hypothetical protein ACT4TC_18420, partial [Myxococcaceae bacterium]